MVEVWDIIKHHMFRDVCMLVVTVTDTLIVVEWCNLGFTRSWRIGKFFQLDKATFKSNDWFKHSGNRLVCLRYSSWVPLESKS